MSLSLPHRSSLIPPLPARTARKAAQDRSAAGRMPGRWLAPLAAFLAAATLLPAPAGLLVALAAVILLGVPHGALDGEVARPWLRPRFGIAWFGVFALPYLSLSALVLLCWRWWPEATLAGFLLVSVLHFGEEDSGGAGPAEVFLRGGLPVALPVLVHPAATAAILGTVARLDWALPPDWLVLPSLFWLLLAPLTLLHLWRRGRRAAAGEVAVLAALFALLPPFTAFALYFVGCHAPRHMRALVADRDRAPRLHDMAAAIRRAVPVTVLTLLLGALLWPVFLGAPADRLLALTLQGLAALTLPHLLLERLVTALLRHGAAPEERITRVHSLEAYATKR